MNLRGDLLRLGNNTMYVVEISTLYLMQVTKDCFVAIALCYSRRTCRTLGNSSTLHGLGRGLEDWRTEVNGALEQYVGDTRAVED